MNNILLYSYKDRLQLQTWHQNNFISEEMKKFFIDLIDNMDENNRQLNIIRNELDLTTKYLNGKSLDNEYDKFKTFIQTNNYSVSDNTIKSFFRKNKIEKILKENI